MIQKKICMLGSFAVGKTSLVSRYVRSLFSQRYHTTIGVKVDKKVVQVDDQILNLILWDIHGEDEFQEIPISYLRGTSGYLLVVDGTRQSTLDQAFVIQKKVVKTVGRIPFVLVLNKSDLEGDWVIAQEVLDEFATMRWDVLRTSAKTGNGVEEAFLCLAQRMLGEERG